MTESVLAVGNDSHVLALLVYVGIISDMEGQGS